MSAPRTAGDEPLEVCLTLPGVSDYARVARLAMAGVASRNGLSYDEVEDLRIAVGEVFALLVQPAEDDVRVRFRYRLLDDAVEIEAERVPSIALRGVDELSTLILRAVVDEATIDGPGGRVSLLKRSASGR